MPRPQPQDSGKRLVASWSRGERISGTREYFAGMFLDVGVDPDLDAAATAAEWPRGKMVHGDGGVREHFLIPSPTLLYVLIAGIPYTTVGALAADPGTCARLGIACTWPRGSTSALSVHVLFDPLVRQGYMTPIPFVVKSTYTDDLVAALVAHNDVLDRAEKAMDRAFEFYQVALPIIAGEEEQRASRANAEVSSPVSPIKAAHPDKLTAKYIKLMMASDEVSDVALAQKDEIQRYVALFQARAVQPDAAPVRR